MKMGQLPIKSYTEHMNRTQARSHDSKGLPSDKCENAQLRHNLLTCIIAILQWFCFQPGYVLQVGPASTLELVVVFQLLCSCIGVNQPLGLESVT